MAWLGSVVVLETQCGADGQGGKGVLCASGGDVLQAASSIALRRAAGMAVLLLSNVLIVVSMLC